MFWKARKPEAKAQTEFSVVKLGCPACGKSERMDATTDGAAVRRVTVDFLTYEGEIVTREVGRGVVCLHCGTGYFLCSTVPGGVVELPKGRGKRVEAQPEHSAKDPVPPEPPTPAGTMRGMEGYAVLPGEP